MMDILAHQSDAPLLVGLLDIFDRNVLLAVDVDRKQLHIAPENVVDVVQLLVQHDIAAFEQRIHAVAYDINRPVALRQIRNVDVIHRLPGRLVQK